MSIVFSGMYLILVNIKGYRVHVHVPCQKCTHTCMRFYTHLINISMYMYDKKINGVLISVYLTSLFGDTTH